MRVAIFKNVLRGGGLTEKVTCEQRPEGGEKITHEDLEEENSR
jgi:hypothetical protein